MTPDIAEPVRIPKPIAANIELRGSRCFGVVAPTDVEVVPLEAVSRVRSRRPYLSPEIAESLVRHPNRHEVPPFTDPVWRRMGGELYYRAGKKVMMVAVDTGGTELRASAPRMLFEGPYYEGTGASCEMGGPSSANYDVTPDGQRFLMVRDPTDAIAGMQVVVVLNWAEELKAKERARAQQVSRAN